jgi:hypothetical protein
MLWAEKMLGNIPVPELRGMALFKSRALTKIVTNQTLNKRDVVS